MMARARTGCPSSGVPGVEFVGAVGLAVGADVGLAVGVGTAVGSGGDAVRLADGNGLAVGDGLADGCAAAAGTGWIETNRPSHAIGTGGYDQRVKKRRSWAGVSFVSGGMS